MAPPWPSPQTAAQPCVFSPGVFGCWSLATAARQELQKIDVTLQPDLPVLSGLFRELLSEGNALAVGFGETASSNYSLS